MRKVIVHYHIYKNSGTSFERVLDESFGPRHIRFDGPFPFFTIDQVQLDRIIRRHRDAQAFSSHQTQLPHPSALDYQVIAALFLRHPILRIASIYRFKRKTRDGTPASELAQTHEFPAFIEACFRTAGQLPHISNGQTRHLSAVHGSNPEVRRLADKMIYDLATARRNLANVELLGRTDHFEQDVQRFAGIAAGHDLILKVPSNTRHNTTEDSSGSVEERVERTLSELPGALRQKLLAANAQDLALYADAAKLIEGRVPG